MPKKLKLGVSAAWSSDSSGWGAPLSSAAPADDWGGWGTGGSWGNTEGDIWETVEAPAAADPPPDWGYDDGWGGPAPNLQAEDTFPSLADSKPTGKRSNRAEPPPQKPKPADFSTVLGTKQPQSLGSVSGAIKRQNTPSNQTLRSDRSTDKGWIQQSIDRNKGSTNRGSTGRGSTNSYLQHVTTQPTQTLQQIFYTPPSSVKETLDQGSPEPRNRSLTSDKTETIDKPADKRVPDIYEQLKEQLQRVAGLGKPLVYIIQNGSITVQVAED